MNIKDLHNRPLDTHRIKEDRLFPIPWRMKMTVCIAATCMHNNIPRIVLCTDWKVTSSLGSAETMDKFYKLKEGWFALGCGLTTSIHSLVREYKRYLSTIEIIDETNITQVMREPLVRRKREMIEEYIQGKYTISYDDFLKFGKEKLPDDIFKEEVRKIKKMSLGASLLIIGFTGEIPNICRTEAYDEDNLITLEENHAVIGEGELVAEPVFFRRNHDADCSMIETIFYVLEAKIAAENVSSVGEDTTLVILSKSGTAVEISDKGWKFFEKLYKKYHPKLNQDAFVFNDDYFDGNPI